MKIYRGGRTQNGWSDMTDAKAPSAYIDKWEPGGLIVFDGTIDKNGKRHTDFGVGIDEDDVIAMHATMVKKLQQSKDEYAEEISELENEISELKSNIDDLKKAFAKLHGLIKYHCNDAPSEKQLIADICEISREFMNYSDELGGVDLEWIEWEQIKTVQNEYFNVHLEFINRFRS